MTHPRRWEEPFSEVPGRGHTAWARKPMSQLPVGEEMEPSMGRAMGVLAGPVSSEFSSLSLASGWVPGEAEGRYPLWADHSPQ